MLLMHRLGRFAVRAGSGLVLLAVVAGIPAGLTVFIGWPLPHDLPASWNEIAAIVTGGFPDTAVVGLLAVALWLVWAAFVHALTVEVAATRRGQPARRIRLISPMQALAALLVAGLAAGPATAASVAVTTPIPAVTGPAPAVAPYAIGSASPQTGQAVTAVAAWPSDPNSTTATNLTPRAVSTAPVTSAAGPSSLGGVPAGQPRFALAARTGPLTITTAGSQYTVIVQHGDTLWDLAQAWLADAHRWPEIYKLNTDRYDEHGRMRGGDHIERAWRLVLPADATPPADAKPRTFIAPATPRKPANPPADTAPTAPPAATSPTPAPSATSGSTAARGGSGVVGNQSGPARPSTTAAVPSASAAPSASSTATSREPASPGPDAEPARSGRSSPSGVSLTGDSWVDLGLALAIAAAATTVWRLRRRRYTPRPVSPELRLDDPDLIAMPPTVNEIRRRLHADEEPDDSDNATTSTFTFTGTDTSHAASADDDLGGADESIRAATDDIDESQQDEPALETGEVSATRAPQQVRPVVPTLDSPATVAWPSSGLGLTGPGAEAAARGFLAAALADTDPGAAPGQVVLPSTVAATLLGAAAVTLPTTPRLIVTDDLGDALALLEQQILHRSRLVYAHEVDTVAAMRSADAYEEPTPPMLVIADAGSSHERTRISALLAQGQRLDIHSVLLGDWPDGNTITVDTDGTTSTGDPGRHGRHPADIGRLAVLTPAETIAVITTLAEAHTGLPQPIPPAGPRPDPLHTDAENTPTDTAEPVPTLDDTARVLLALAELGDATAAAIAAHVGIPFPTVTPKLVASEHAGNANTSRTDTGKILWGLTDAGRVAAGISTIPDERQAATKQMEPAETEAPAHGPFADVDTALRWPDPDTQFTSEPQQQPATDDTDDTAQQRGHIEVTVLGEAGIVATNPDRRPRKKALELLVYLAVHDGSATAEAILDDLLPDAPASKAPERLYTYVSDLRSVMRRIGGPATYLTHPHRRYVLNPDAIDVDLWHMRAALRDATQASDKLQRLSALRRAVDAYRGPLADGTDYEWAEPYREAIRQQALDAHLALADALTDDPAARAQVLEAAIGHSPYSEHLYQEAMRARAQLGHLDVIRALRRSLDRALTEIDTEASDDTITLAEQLIADLQNPGRRTEVGQTTRTG
ncbi:BTAD domain-containing putative transcriptional regulator [Actinoplanes sp. NPDC026623]|uniref:BTAD domain-containing putative transcriptional regulator n=1 Tax=Actinoplanes sp. NPDC026623 TaxID=3155610 RepID=UPI003400B30A